MARIAFIFIGILIILKTLSCQTVQNKTDEIVKKENIKLSKFIGQEVEELKIVMGVPDDISKSASGSTILIYKKKKYGISCERKFEINESEIIIGFTSKGCF